MANSFHSRFNLLWNAIYCQWLLYDDAHPLRYFPRFAKQTCWWSSAYKLSTSDFNKQSHFIVFAMHSDCLILIWDQCVFLNASTCVYLNMYLSWRASTVCFINSTFYRKEIVLTRFSTHDFNWLRTMVTLIFELRTSCYLMGGFF